MIRKQPLVKIALVAIAAIFVRHIATASETNANSSTGLVIAPFAIPVAVPVAVVQRPTLFYGMGTYAPQTASAASPSSARPAITEDTLRSEVTTILRQHCIECHRGSLAQGDLSLFDVDSRLLEKLPRHLVLEQTTSAEGKLPAMPPGARVRLTSEEQELIRRWAKLPKRLSY
ncbi:MAG: hypothetical protein K8U03_06715 [Planctomycetia bacterium]|nr:hypothetical protein [Planctomycetia bacterium]